MHRYGGMYADLDMEALRDLGPILEKETQPVFSAMQVPPSPLKMTISGNAGCCNRVWVTVVILCGASQKRGRC